VLKTVALGLALMVVLLLGGWVLIPRERHVQRAITIEAPGANVYTLIAGREKVLEARPFSSITTAEARFALSPDGRGTRVVRSVDVKLNTFANRRIDAAFGRRLADLKALAETMPKTDVSALVADVVETVPRNVAYVEETSTQDPAAIAAAIGDGTRKVGAFLKAHGLKPAGPVLTINTRWADGVYAFDAAIPVDRLPDGAADPEVKVKPTYGGRAVKAIHRGAYASLPVTYAQIHAYLALRSLTSAGTPWDEYVSDPALTQEPDLITHVYQPVK